jgi:EpsI family protein
MNLIAWRFPITFLLLAATIAAVKWSDQPRPERLAQPLDSVAVRIGGWTMAGRNDLSESVEDRLEATSYLNREYQRDGLTVALFIAYYGQQRAGESMHSPRNCLPGNGWEIWNQGTVEIPFHGRQSTINQFSIRNDGERLLVYYWYQSRRRIIADEYLGKLLLVRDALVDGRTAGSIVRVMAPDNPDGARGAREFAPLIEQEMERCLGQ